jgi:hypothetical protein
MGTLNTEPNIAAPDDFYERLIAMHHDLSDAQSALFNARLILLLANHIGDAQVLDDALQAARGDIVARSPVEADSARSTQQQ